MTVFSYPASPHARRHGPQGYTDYKHYKPWLRDEFSFRCAYCLCRETWYPGGDASFGADHVTPRSSTGSQDTSYDDLVYACCLCNGWKRDRIDLIGWHDIAWGDQLRVLTDGTVQALTPLGEKLIDACALDRPDLVAYRRDLIALLAFLANRRGAEAARLRHRFLSYPDDLPDLALLRPPAGNRRPEGIAQSAHASRQRGELPDLY